MFGLSVIQERLISLGIIVLIVFGFAWHERYLGAQKCVQNIEKANVLEEHKEAIQHDVDVITIQSEGKTYEKATTEPIAPAPVVRVCPSLHSPGVPASPGSGPQAHGGTPGGERDQGEPTFWDSKPVVQAGHDADAQIRGLQDYVINVCRPAILP